METKVHRVRYYTPKPQPINCISFNKTSKHLALARSDASIEVWDLSYAPYIIKFIPGVENGSVEALSWVHDRLLSTGLGGALVEWDLEKLVVKITALLSGYAAWCLDVNSANTLCAVGTEQGYVNLYNVENNEIVYNKLFDKQEGRIMCCKFDKTGQTLVTGSIDSIRVWNVETGHAISRMTVTRRGKETIVWCLAVLSDNIVVSGDSNGRLTFWDGSLGDQIESFTTHRADILSIAVSEDEKKIYCSGVDPVIVNFIKVSKGSDQNDQWVKNLQRNIHEHDVRSLIIHENKLISVGVDGYLTLSGYPPKWVTRIPPMIPLPRFSVCSKKKLLLLRYSNYLEIWKLGSYETNKDGNYVLSSMQQSTKSKGNKNTNLEQDSLVSIIQNTVKTKQTKKSLKLSENPVKLATIQAKGKKQIKCCAMSPNGEFIVYSTDSHIRMLKLETDDDLTNTSLSKLQVSGAPSTCSHAVFTSDSTLTLQSAGVVTSLHVDSEAGAAPALPQLNLANAPYLKSPSILHMVVSEKTPSGTTYLVLADTLGAIGVWTRSAKKYEPYAALPRYRCVPSAITIDAKNENLIVAYVDQNIVEFDLVSKRFSEWARGPLPPAWAARRTPAFAISPHPAGDGLLCQDQNSLFVLRKLYKKDEMEPEVKKTARNVDVDIQLRVIPFKYLCGFAWLGEDEAVALELSPEDIVAMLPPPLAIKRHT